MKDKKIKANGMTQIMMDLLPKRVESNVYLNHKMDFTNLKKYLENVKKKNNNITYFYAMVTALGKIFYNRETLNYYIRNRHIYKHRDIVISFVAKVSFEDYSKEVMVLIPIEPKDNLYTISEKIKSKINNIRNKNNDYEENGANKAINIFGKLPNVVRVPLVGMLKLFDKWGILPKSLIEDNLYYSSVIVSNLGSIKCGTVYHHLCDFGTCSGIITIGEIKDEEVLINGKKEIRSMCEFGINIDERIADGYYFAKSVKYLEYVFNNPKLLEYTIDTKIEIEENR